MNSRAVFKVLKSNRADDSNRSGIITFWMIVSIPIFLIALAVVLEVGNLWAARIQLKNALESAAMAAVKTWGDAGAGDTAFPRQVGNNFSSANIINGRPVDLTEVDPSLNYSAGTGLFQNDECDGVFVFGSIRDDGQRFQFDTCQPAGCGSAYSLVLDVTAEGEIDGDNDWGISFQPGNGNNSSLSIHRVTYELPNVYRARNGQVTNPVFDFTGESPTVSPSMQDNQPSNRVRCGSGDIDCDLNQNGPQGPLGTSQADIFGVNPNQVSFLIGVQTGDDPSGGRRECSRSGRDVTGQTHPSYRSKTLTLEFCDPGSNSGCNPFTLGDRIRFQAPVRDRGQGQGQAPVTIEADDIGRMGVQVTVCFHDGTFVRGTFVDTFSPEYGPNACPCTDVEFASWGNCQIPRQGMIIHPTRIPDLPCSRSLYENNDEQSIVQLGGGSSGGGGFPAVRVQARYEVPSLCSQLCGLTIGPFFATACADAYYDCRTGKVRLYHLETSRFGCRENCP
ncbi:pilus assembly protein TadG-related protein [Thalassoglobus sp. JC818]|uniref:TadE/TadG family type IV pilus assembly protein n=1 Tax=Thalassoglobus sp. JC818 TaxID=3232136 RepID=UPI00345A4648